MAQEYPWQNQELTVEERQMEYVKALEKRMAQEKQERQRQNRKQDNYMEEIQATKREIQMNQTLSRTIFEPAEQQETRDILIKENNRNQEKVELIPEWRTANKNVNYFHCSQNKDETERGILTDSKDSDREKEIQINLALARIFLRQA